MVLASESRKHLRSIMKQVHPDLFPANDFERQTNTESLKTLNVYVDQLSTRRSPRPALVEFFVKDGVNMKKVEARLTTNGSLGPLFFAFGFIDAAQLAKDDSLSGSDSQDTNFMAWLRGQVQEAVRTAEQHDMLKLSIRKLRSNLEEKYKLTDVQAGAEYAASITEQERQVEALKVLDLALSDLANQGVSYEGISILLYHPTMSPQETTGFMDDAGFFDVRTESMKAFVADDGCVHVVAERSTIKQQLAALDLKRARTLANASSFWVRRVRDVTGPVEALLGVRKVWCDTKTEQISQKYVLWAGYLLERSEQIKASLAGRSFSFNIIVHTDAQAPLVSFNTGSPILNVSADCPPDHLVEFLVSEAAGAASETAGEVHVSRAKEESLLENVRKALNAKCVIKICMSEQVLEGAKRLLDNAPLIRSSIDLTGACIALDDCYEVWDSGFISIPYDFRIQDLPEMVRMLQSGQRVDPPSASTYSSAGKIYSTSQSSKKQVKSTVLASTKARAQHAGSWLRFDGAAAGTASTARPAVYRRALAGSTRVARRAATVQMALPRVSVKQQQQGKGMLSRSLYRAF